MPIQLTPRAAAAALSMCAVNLLLPQLPGDRPAPNPRATRSVVMARRGMIATSQPLASAAGLQVLREGGNAVDAAVTAAAVLSVVEPTMNGIGGDLFAIVYDAKTKRLAGLNASGRAGRAATPEEFRRRGVGTMPERGVLAVTVPGVVDGWSELLARHGTIGLARALQPAIEYARDGFPVPEIIATMWKDNETVLQADPPAARDLPAGRAGARDGAGVREPGLARTLEAIARGGRDAFYRGPIAAAIADDMRRRDGLLDAADFAAHRSDWVRAHLDELPRLRRLRARPEHPGLRRPRDVEYPRGLRPQGGRPQLRGLPASPGRSQPHRVCRSPVYSPTATRCRPTCRRCSFPRSTRRAGERTSRQPAQPTRIRPERRVEWLRPWRPCRLEGTGDTIYLTAVDGQGNAVSLIQSLYDAFGAGIVAGETGIALQNRGALFTLEANHPNQVAPRKRPFHTLVPAMVMKDGRPWLSFGVMGGDMQPQGHVQVLLNLIDFGMNVQEAGEAARYRLAGRNVALESAIGSETRAALEKLGHRVTSGVGMGAASRASSSTPARAC